MANDSGTAAERSATTSPAATGGSTIPQPRDTEALKEAFGWPLPTYIPRRYKPRNIGSWSDHLAFAHDLIAATAPELIVELGTHWGEAYFTFCQTVQEQGLNSLCYAVDHWRGDEHAGRYGEEVYEDVRKHNIRFYSQFSYLIRSSFDEAVTQFADESIGLLHIDGFHTYEAARHDFLSWLPKVKPGGIVMLHDICGRHEDFGVWRTWDEIKAEHKNTFEFHHGWGLGVVRKEGGPSPVPMLEYLFSGVPEVEEEIRRRYVVYSSHLENLLLHPENRELPEILSSPSTEIGVQVFPFGKTGHSEETSLLQKLNAGVLTDLIFELPDGIGDGHLRIDPGSQPSLIEIRELQIHSLTSGEVLWELSGKNSFYPGGDAVLLPSETGYFLSSHGDDPQIALANPKLEGPVKVTISLIVTPAFRAGAETVEALFKVEQSVVDQARADRDYSAQQLNHAQELLRGLERELHQERAVRRDMQESLSWRITRPLRKLKSLFKSD